MHKFKKVITILVIVIAVLLAYFVLSQREGKNPIPDELARSLLFDILTYSKVGINTTADILLGDETYQYQVENIEYIIGTDMESDDVEACIEIKMLYGNSPRPPTEYFLYRVYKINDNWFIRYVRQSEVNEELSNNSCNYFPH